MPGDGFVCACVCVSHCVRWAWLQALQLLDQTAHLRRIFSRGPTGQLSPLLGSKMFSLSCRTSCGYGQLSVLCFVYFELLVTHLSCVLLPALVHPTSPPLLQFSLQLQTANQGHLPFSSVSSLTTITQTQIKP